MTENDGERKLPRGSSCSQVQDGRRRDGVPAFAPCDQEPVCGIGGWGRADTTTTAWPCQAPRPREAVSGCRCSVFPSGRAPNVMARIRISR